MEWDLDVLITINQLSACLKRGVIETAPNIDWSDSWTGFTGGDSRGSLVDGWSGFSIVI